MPSRTQDYYVLSANSIASATGDSLKLCPSCSCPSTSDYKNISLYNIDGKNSSNFYGIYFSNKFPAFQVFSEKSVAFLGDSCCSWDSEPIYIKKSPFFIPRPLKIIPFVGNPKLEVGGFECKTCGNRVFGYFEKNSTIHKYLSLKDVCQAGDCFFVGTKKSFFFAMSSEFEKKVSKNKIFNKSDYNYLGVIENGVAAKEIKLISR